MFFNICSDFDLYAQNYMHLHLHVNLYSTAVLLKWQLTTVKFRSTVSAPAPSPTVQQLSHFGGVQETLSYANDVVIPGSCDPHVPCTFFQRCNVSHLL